MDRIPEASCTDYQRDSVVIPGLFASTQMYAVAGDGRWHFRLFGQRMSSIHRPNDDEDNIGENESATFTLGVIDIFTSRVVIIDSVGDLYAFGKLCAMYALDENTIIISDFHKHTRLLKQRVIHVDSKAVTARYVMHRAYSMQFDDFPYCEVINGTNTAVIAPVVNVDLAYTFPVDPLSKERHRDITDLILMARSHVRQHYSHRARGNFIDLSAEYFVIMDTAIGFFVSRNALIDLTTTLVVDLSSNSVYLQDIVLPTSKTDWAGNAVDEMQLICAQENDRTVVVLVDNDSFFGFTGVLDTRLLIWTELENFSKEDASCYPMCSRGGDYFLLSDEVRHKTGSRCVGEVGENGEKMERLRLIAHPFRVPSLARLASIAVQKGGRGLSELQLLQIGERFV